MDGCLACDLTAGVRELPGGCIFESEHVRVEHCIGPLGVGTLIVKPRRHVLHVADLSDGEASELGLAVRNAAAVVTALLDPHQTYACLWSHMGRRPVHIHWVVQPVSEALMEEFDAHGPALQVAMFARNELPDPAAATAFAARAREVWPEG